MKFTKEYLQDFDGKTISDEIYDSSRWSNHYERIFEHEGKFYRTQYSMGATEQQDEHPYEYDEEEIECEEVFPIQVTITKYLSQGQIDARSK